MARLHSPQTWLVLGTLLGLILACDPPTFPTPPSTCQSTTDCAGSQVCDKGNCVYATSTNPPTACDEGETRECYEGPAGTAGVSNCLSGKQTCRDGTWSLCENQVLPTPKEVCGNDTDDDCNGKNDSEEPDCQECTPGTKEDCDYSGPRDKMGQGICKQGSKTCQPGGSWGACEGEVLPKEVDCSSSQDNDCNGIRDNQESQCGTCNPGDTQKCYTGTQGTENIGACKGGTQTCTAQRNWGPCEGEVTPEEKEICLNGKDDTCSGKSEMEFPKCLCESSKDCDLGLFCYQRIGSKQGACLKSCTQDSNCLTGQYCVKVGAASGLFCLPARGKNKPCDLSQFQACRRGLVCQDKKCQLPKQADKGQPCDAHQTTCKEGLACAFLPMVGRCAPSCAKNTCPTGLTCIKTPTASICLKTCKSNRGCPRNIPICTSLGPNLSKVCAPKGTRKAWQSCFQGGENCATGLRCLTLPKLNNLRRIGYCTPDNCQTPGCPSPGGGIDTKKYFCTEFQGKSCILPCAGANQAICSKIPGFQCRTFSGAPSYCNP